MCSNFSFRELEVTWERQDTEEATDCYSHLGLKYRRK